MAGVYQLTTWKDVCLRHCRTPAQYLAGRFGPKLLDGVEKQLGMVPNVIATMAQSHAALQAYLSFSQSLSDGLIPARLTIFEGRTKRAGPFDLTTLTPPK